MLHLQPLWELYSIILSDVHIIIIFIGLFSLFSSKTKYMQIP